MSGKTRSEEEAAEIIQAQNGPQAFMLSCPVESIIYGGARGGGKSFGLLLDFAKHATSYGRNARGLLLRRRYKDLEQLIDDSKRIYGDRGLGWNFNEKPPTWKSPEGAILRMRAVDKDSDAEKFKGFGNSWLGIDEIGDFPNPAPIDKLWGSLRSAHGVPVVRRASANPGGSGHAWVYKRYIKDRDPYKVFEEVPLPTERPDLKIKTVFIPSRLEDNPALKQSDPDYESRLAMAGGPQVFRAWRWGDWSVLAGQYFDIFDPKIHVKDARIVLGNLQPWHQRWISLDWGFADDYTAVYWHAKDENSVVYTYRELYVRGKIAPDIGTLIVDANGEDKITVFYVDPDILAHKGATHTIAEEIASVTTQAGIPFPAKADNDRIGGWALMYQMLLSGNWFISDSCKNLIESLPLLVRDEDKLEDVAESSVDHAPDACRYGLKSFLGSVRVPFEKLLREKLEKISNFTQRYQVQLAETQKNVEAPYIRRRSRYYRPWSN